MEENGRDLQGERRVSCWKRDASFFLFHFPLELTRIYRSFSFLGSPISSEYTSTGSETFVCSLVAYKLKPNSRLSSLSFHLSQGKVGIYELMKEDSVRSSSFYLPLNCIDSTDFCLFSLGTAQAVNFWEVRPSFSIESTDLGLLSR